MEHIEIFRTYTEKIISSINPEYPAWNGEYVISGRKNKWNYIDGCMIHSLLEISCITKDEKLFGFCEKFVSGFVDETGCIRTYDPYEFNLDNINPARNLITLYEITGKYKYHKAFENVYNNQLLNQPRTVCSHNFWHKKIYPQQIWLDGIYMAFPFYAEYEVKYNNCRNTDDIISQFTTVENIMRDENTGLYYHGYDESMSMDWADKKTGLSSCFWLRAMGWFMSALTDTYEKLDRVSEKADTVLKRIMNNLTENIVKYSHKNGMFSQIVDMPLENGNYCETSGTLLVAYAIFKAVRLGMIDEKYIVNAEKAFNGVIENCIEKGDDGSITLGNICLVAGLGGDNNRDGSIGYYLSEPIVKNDAKGIAPLLMVYSEFLKR